MNLTNDDITYLANKYDIHKAELIIEIENQRELWKKSPFCTVPANESTLVRKAMASLIREKKLENRDR